MNPRGLREHVPSVLVAGLSSAFGVSVLQFFAVLTQVIAENQAINAAGAISA